MTIIAILHPGRMGAAIGATLVSAGHDVRWLPAGRGPGTHRRAAEAGLRPADDLAGCDVVLSVCPPTAAVDGARGAAGVAWGAAGSAHLYVDANAVSPATARAVAEIVADGGTRYVDGSIIGSPPTADEPTTLYLSGERADEVVAVFDGTRVEAVALPGGGTAASALKMTYAAWTKITASLLVGIRATARDLGVDEALLAEWARSQPGLAERSARAERSAAERGWRWAEEMRQVAATFAGSGQPAGFGETAADVFDRCSRPPDE
jgi:3-hydroxyisobutyrate dehydrogenase-like beta-hydroxyacid dehydrogenase